MNYRQHGQELYFPIPGGPGYPGGPGIPGGGNVNQRLDRLERQVDRLDRRVGRIERRLGIRDHDQEFYY
ncbi:hypothetical protein [Bacillus sp. REN3]|uniref:hypothetical protein n=1 Tax=Bacillus sp. REN3 TaxID=2802440 RepID=UPI001AED951E|nr:hypothetical protein [Bacillus sp. REN3]